MTPAGRDRVLGVRTLPQRKLRPAPGRDEHQRGDELFDLPDAPRPGPDTPAPPRFLPYYDNVLLAHADRTRVIPPEPSVQFFPSDGLLVGTVLLDGFLGARWKIRRDGGKATLIIETFERLRRQDRAALAEEGARLAAFAAAESGERASVEIRPPARSRAPRPRRRRPTSTGAS